MSSPAMLAATRLAADHALARRDRALPGLGLLLDEAALTARLQAALPNMTVGAARATYVRYKPGTSCLVAYRIDLDGVEQEVYAKAYGSSTAADKLANARQRLAGRGAGGFILDEEAIVVSLFPFDHRLRTLHRLADPARRSRLFKRLLRTRPDLWHAEPRPLRYKPERRYVAALGEGADAVLVRLYTRREYAAVTGSPQMASSGPLRVPTRLARSDRYHALAFSWMPGQPLDHALHRGEVELATLSRVGEALATLHAQPGDGLRARAAEDEARALYAAAGGVAAVCPSLAGRAHRLARHLASQLDGEAVAAATIHGDFSADQVVLDGDRVAIIDLDNVARGNPLLDLGTFVAQLARNSLLDTPLHAPLGKITGALLAGYASLRPGHPLDRLNLYVAMGLVRLAPHAFRNRRLDWPRETEAVLDLAADYASRLS